MFTVRLAQVKTFNIGRVPAYIINKKVVIIIHVPVIKSQSHFPVNSFKRLFALLN